MWFLASTLNAQVTKQLSVIQLNNNNRANQTNQILLLATQYNRPSAEHSSKLVKRLIAEKYNTWTMELLLRFGVNNNFVIFQTPVVPGIITYRQHLVKEHIYKGFNKTTFSTMLFGFTTGRCGFVRNQKRTFLATDITIRAALWICKRVYKFLFGGIKVRFLGRSKLIQRHLSYFRRFYMGNRRVKLHSLIDVTPAPYNGVRQKGRGRKRYRYHQYNYNRFRKIFRNSLPSRKKPLLLSKYK